MTCTGIFELKEIPENAALLFHGLDCYSTVSVNGVKLGETDICSSRGGLLFPAS